MDSMETKKKLTTILIHVILIIVSITMLVPFIWMILTAFKTVTEATSVDPFTIFPKIWRKDAFISVINNMNFLLLYKNTLLLIFFRVVCAVLTATMAGYAFGRLNFKGRDLCFSLVLFQMMVPVQIFIIQQYLMVSAGAQLILAECAARGCNYHDLADYAAIQINDTHPSMVIPELIRLLGEKGIEFDEAVKIVTDTCAYTNHTILAEALETWPRSYLDKVVPQLMPVIEKLDAAAKKRTNDTPFGQIFACRQRLERFLCHTAFRDDVIQGGAEFAGIVRDNDLRFRENPLHVAEGGPGADHGGQYLGPVLGGRDGVFLRFDLRFQPAQKDIVAQC